MKKFKIIVGFFLLLIFVILSAPVFLLKDVILSFLCYIAITCIKLIAKGINFFFCRVPCTQPAE